MSFLSLSLSALFGKKAEPAPAAPTQAMIAQNLEQQVAWSGRRHYYTVHFSEGQDYAGLEAAFEKIGFKPQPRIRMGDAFIGSGARDNQNGTAMVLAKQSVIDSLRNAGYAIAIDLPPNAQPGMKPALY